jgi:hypothetical protein
VFLKGVIKNTSTDVYYGSAGLLGAGSEYEFVKISRELDAPGTTQPGFYDFTFCFRNVEMECDTYRGIALKVVWSVCAEMVYQGNLMSYTVADEQVFTVRN